MQSNMTITFSAPKNMMPPRMLIPAAPATLRLGLCRLEVALGRIRKAHPGAHLEVACEAGPCGFGISRRLKQPRALRLEHPVNLMPTGFSTV
jgi:hypothetical protein